MTTTSSPTTAFSNRGALFVTILLGAAAAVWTFVHALLRVIEIAPNRDVPVTAAFADTPATLPIGPGGEAVKVVAQQVVFRVSDLAPASYLSLLLSVIIPALATIAVIVCVCLLCRHLMSGRAFDRRGMQLVNTAIYIAVGAWPLTWLFSIMAANGGTAALGDGASTNTATPIDLITPFAFAALGVVAIAFQIGHRLQRDSDGLV